MPPNLSLNADVPHGGCARAAGRRLAWSVRRPQYGVVATFTDLNVKTAQEAVETYIRAKDQNRPYLMERAFAEIATLEMVVNTGTISFPPISNGLGSISDVLVRRFAQTYENVHTFCLAPPPHDDRNRYSCDWLVGMSEKEVGPCVLVVAAMTGCFNLRARIWSSGLRLPFR
jgi:hypothetical protein